MTTPTRSIVLADDDDDDCTLFEEALREIETSTELTTAHDGEQLMRLLNGSDQLPDALFLDLNMPRKNGFECLTEIKKNQRWKKLHVIIFSTSLQQDVADLLYKHGAHHYIRKPASYNELKKIIEVALSTPSEQPTRENFVLT